jgi:hypothetical protein
MTVTAASNTDEGDELPAPSETELAARRGCKVPAEHEVAVTVIEEPEEEEGVKTQPVAVPRLVKSAAVRPETFLEKVSV